MAGESFKGDNGVSLPLAEVISLARKVTPATVPPGGLRYSLDQGPLEALPSRFRLPFPTQDEMRLSLVAAEGHKAGAAEVHTVPVYTSTVPLASSPQVKVVIREEEDDYEGEFD